MDSHIRFSMVMCDASSECEIIVCPSGFFLVLGWSCCCDWSVDEDSSNFSAPHVVLPSDSWHCWAAAAAARSSTSTSGSSALTGVKAKTPTTTAASDDESNDIDDDECERVNATSKALL